MPAPYTDWNVYLQDQANPPPPEIPMPADPMATFQMPTDPSIRPEQIGKAIDFMYGLHKRRVEASNAARRYKGQQDFQRIRGQLLSANEPEETATYKAFSQTAGDLFPDNPLHAAQALRALKPAPPRAAPHVPAIAQTVQEKGTGQLLYDELSRMHANEAREQKLYDAATGDERTSIARKIMKIREDIKAKDSEYRNHLAQTTARMSGGFPMAAPTAPPTVATQPAPGLNVNPASALPASGVRPAVTAPAGKIALKRKKDGQIMFYPAGRRAEVPLDQFDILP